MDRDSTSRAARTVRVRVLHWRVLDWRDYRWQGAAAAALLLAACARWPLPGVSNADAAPQLIPKTRLQTGPASTNSAVALADHTDGLRTFGGASGTRSGAGQAATTVVMPQMIAIESARVPADRDASAGVGSGAAMRPSSQSAPAVSRAVDGHATATNDASAGVATTSTGDGAGLDGGVGSAAGAEGSEASAPGDGLRAAENGVGTAVVGPSSGATSSGKPAAKPAVRDAARHPVAATVVPGSLGATRKNDDINERAKWWLAGIAATLLLLFFAGRRKRRPQRVMKMNTHRAEPVGSPRPSTSPNLRATEKPRVRMFSAYEVYAPTHESHRGPWEAPVTTERGFAHRYHLGDEVSEGLLFVAEPEFEPEQGWTPAMSSYAAQAADPAAFTATVTTPAGPAIDADAYVADQAAASPTSQEAIASASVPLVFPVEAAQPERARAQASFDERAPVQPYVEVPAPRPATHASEPAPVRSVVDPAALLPAEAAIAAIGAISAVERDSRAAPAASAQEINPVSHGVETAQAAQTPAAEEAVRPAGATVLALAELGLSAGAAPAPAIDNPVAVQTAASTVAPGAPRDPLLEARKLIESGAYAAALAHLEESLQSPRPPSDAWVMSALCWWQIARADGGSQAYANAAEAMERLLERDPSQTDIWYRTGSCRLLQAGGERGAAQRATLDLAIAALRRAAPEGGQADPLRTATLGDALLERALAATDESAPSRARRMSEAVHVLRAAARAARDPASMASWKLQQALQAQANLLSDTDASKVRLEADAVLAAGVESANEQERLSWYAAKVENELAHAELAEGATRALHLRTFRENYRDVLTGPDAAPELLLSWLELLALETGHLRGDAARSRFDEGEAILKRLDAMLPGNAHVALARARLLRRRAAQSNALSRPAALADAIAGLMPLVERGDAPQLQIETAELMLDRAACVPSTQTADEHARVEAMASGLLQHPVFAMAAARCVLQARLGQSSGPVDPAVCSRLEALAGNDVRSRWLLARAALRNGSAREACGHCEAAARSGVRLDQAMVQLWDQASRKWSATLHGQKDAAWLANKQSLRSAG